MKKFHSLFYKNVYTEEWGNLMKKEKKSVINRIIYFITLVFLFFLVYFAYQYYQTKNLNDFVRSERNLFTSQFVRDNEVKYGKNRSYKIVSNEYNDAMFYKKVKVEKNMPYKLTCMVKTKNVIPEEQTKGIGAQISIEGSTERSTAIQGTNDWQKIELIFNSKDREEVNLGFRLGGNLGEAKGEAWFSEFTLEEGIREENSNWNFACFIFKTTDVEIDGNHVKLEVTENDISDIKDTINRFETSTNVLSQNKMTSNCDIYEVTTPLNSLSYDDEFGYYVAPEDVEEDIKETISQNDYDHIFVIMRLRR